MNPITSYPRRQQWSIWCGFATAMVVHLLAIRFAAGHVETLTTVEPGPPVSGEVVLEPEQQPPDPADDEIQPPTVTPDSEFTEERATPVLKPRTERKPVRPVKPVGTTTTSLGVAKTFAINSPRPAYPYEARRRNITGLGVATMTIDSTSGRVVEVTMSQGTGSAILDKATTESFRRWQFRSGCPTRVQVPITFTLTGAVY